MTLRGDEGSNSVLPTIDQQARTAVVEEKSGEEKVKDSKLDSGGDSFVDDSGQKLRKA